ELQLLLEDARGAARCAIRLAPSGRRAHAGTGHRCDRARLSSPRARRLSRAREGRTRARNRELTMNALTPATFCRDLIAALEASEGRRRRRKRNTTRSEEHTSELQSRENLV